MYNCWEGRYRSLFIQWIQSLLYWSPIVPRWQKSGSSRHLKRSSWIMPDDATKPWTSRHTARSRPWRRPTSCCQSPTGSETERAPKWSQDGWYTLFTFIVFFAQRCIHFWTLLFFCNAVAFGIFLLLGLLGLNLINSQSVHFEFWCPYAEIFWSLYKIIDYVKQWLICAGYFLLINTHWRLLEYSNFDV